MQDFKKLLVWQRGHKFALQIYGVTKTFPAEEKFGIISQMRRAALSIPTNIAEGCGRESNKELHRFLTIAMGSANEIQYLLLFVTDLEYLNGKNFEELNSEITEIKKMLSSFQRKVKSS